MITGIASLTVGWVIPLPFGVAAVILGHIGMSQVKKTGEQGGNKKRKDGCSSLHTCVCGEKKKAALSKMDLFGRRV
jgi:hypothetical protein